MLQCPMLPSKGQPYAGLTSMELVGEALHRQARYQLGSAKPRYSTDQVKSKE